MAARRGDHLAAAVGAGKHAYLLPPGAIDAAGCRSLERSAAHAVRMDLTLGAGLYWRHDPGFRAAHERVRSGEIGAVRAVEAVWQRGPWRRFDASAPAEENWYFDERLSGDFLLVDCLQSIDLAAWFVGAHPVAARGQVAHEGRRPGRITSSCTIAFDCPGGVAFSLDSRLAPCATTHRQQRLAGDYGFLDLEHPRQRLVAPQQEPRVAAVAAFLGGISDRAGAAPWRDHFDALVASTRTAILGREAARAGRTLRWEDVA